MKKILLLAVMFIAANAFAGIDGGLESGMTKVGVYGGASLPASDWENGTQSFKPGDMGYVFGGEIIRYFVPVFGLGIDVGYMNHGEEEVSPGIKVESNVLSAHVMGRINIFPQQSSRLYIPFGAGISKFEAKYKALSSASEKQSDISFVVGLGAEFDLSPVWTMGIEGRYFYMPLDDEKFGNDYFDSFNIMLKLGARF